MLGQDPVERPNVTVTENQVHPRRDSMILLLPMLLGLVVYTLLMWPSLMNQPVPSFGDMIYNYYYMSLLEGRFDVPARIVSAEGLYAPDGTAYVNQGMAPLMTRVLAAPFVDLRSVSLAGVSILLFAAIGSAAVQVTVISILNRFGPDTANIHRTLSMLAGLAAWFASAGPTLASNDSLYHEPIAVAYAMGALWMAFAARVVVFGERPGKWLLPMAVVAGVTVHAREHVAVGLYAGTVLFALWDLKIGGWRHLPKVGFAMVVLFAFGAALLTVNYMRFGDPLRSAGLEWGFSYWNLYTDEHARIAYNDNSAGSFHPARIPGNALLYFLDLPTEWNIYDLGPLNRRLTMAWGWVGIESPRFGVVFAWAPWFLIILRGVFCARGTARGGWILLLAGSFGAAVVISFATLTIRYRMDLWPLVMAGLVLTLPRVAMAVRAGTIAPRSAIRAGGLTLLLACAVQFAVLPYGILEKNEHMVWSEAQCAEIAGAKGFGADDIARICAL